MKALSVWISLLSMPLGCEKTACIKDWYCLPPYISLSLSHTHMHTQSVYVWFYFSHHVGTVSQLFYVLITWLFFTKTIFDSLQIFATGITVIGMMKRKPRQQEMHKKDHGLHFNDICSTVIGTWITCSLLNLNTNCMHLLRRRWKKCSNIICHGLR